MKKSENRKTTLVNLSFKYILFRIVLLFWLISGWSIASFAQDPVRRLRQDEQNSEEIIRTNRQSLNYDNPRNQMDTTSIQTDTTSMPIQKGEVETTIKYSASDSIFTSLDG
ncbi:MAG: hypothetical protein OEW75_18150, partial [Cyclobacteriaceae bacterium]|nr:hypothetical protein [Cyclobacteriaceae bacterium]